jgi:hypothetical protein
MRPVRGAALEHLADPEEREAWRKLWDDVATRIKEIDSAE